MAGDGGKGRRAPADAAPARRVGVVDDADDGLSAAERGRLTFIRWLLASGRLDVMAPAGAHVLVADTLSHPAPLLFTVRKR